MNTLKQITLSFLIVVLGILLSTQAIAQTNLDNLANLDNLEYGAYLKFSELHWESTVEKRKAAYSESENMSDLFKLAIAQHGLLSATMTDKNEELFDRYLDDTKKNLDMLIGKKYNLGESKALKSSVYGLEMGYNGWKGIYLGPKSEALIDAALAKANNSPLVWLIYANAKFFTPTVFGGNTEEAIKSYKKSIALYEKNDNLKNNWRYLDAHAWLGQAYAQTDQPEKARETYEKILKIEPDFIWVKQALLPKLASK